jgi:hypothetical protein
MSSISISVPPGLAPTSPAHGLSGCVIYFEELRDDSKQISDVCICGMPVYLHARRPITPVIAHPAPGSAPTAASPSIIRPSVNKDFLKSLPKWRKDYQYSREFLLRFEQLCTAADLPPDDWTKQLTVSVPDVQESAWITKHIITPKLNWADACLLFSKHFDRADLHVKLEADYASICQSNKESAQQYADRFSELCVQLGVVDGDGRAIAHFLNGLTRALRRKIDEQVNICKLITKQPLDMSSLDTVIQMAIAFDFGTGGLHLQDDNKGASPATHTGARPNRGRAAASQCINHPYSTTHTTSECQAGKLLIPSVSFKSVPTTVTSQPQSAHASSTRGPIICHKCHQPGHYANVCPQRTTSSGSSASNHNNSSAPTNSAPPLISSLRPITRSLTTSGQAGLSSRSVTFDTDVQDAVVYHDEPVSDDHKHPIDRLDIQSSMINVLDRSLPASVVVPTRNQLQLEVDGCLYFCLADTGATASMIDSTLVKSLSLTIVPPANKLVMIKFAHSDMSMACVGTVSLTPTIFFHGTTKKAVKFKHSFQVLPLRSKSNNYDFIIGVDLLPRFFPDGLPVCFMPEAALSQSNTSHTVLLSTVTLDCDSIRQGSQHADNDSIDSFPIRLPQSQTDVSEQLEILQQSISDVGAGTIPDEEQPIRMSLMSSSFHALENANKRAILMDKLSPYLDINQNLTGFCSLSESIIKLDVAPEALSKLYRRQYKIPQMLVAAANEVVQRWIASGKVILAPVNCPYNNPLMVAPKKDEHGKLTGIRVCIDPRPLNAALLSNDRFPLPLIRDTLQVFGGCSLFGEFDLSEAYLQFLLHPDSRPLTAFTWNGQQYMFMGVPFGLTPVSSIFQRVMSHIFRDIQFTFPYIDNLPFASKTWDEHTDHAIVILDRLNKVNLKVKPSSVKVGYSGIKCLGHMVSVDGISMDPDKVLAINDWTLPCTGVELQSFLGFVTFIRHHVRHFADLTAPLEAVKYSKIIEWTPLLLEHFNVTKNAVSSAPFLQYPDYTRPFHIATDASNTGVGGVLFQPSVPGEYITAHNIVAICSKKLTDSQRRYAAYKKELWGVVYSLRQFHAYVWGRGDLVLITDHKPLTYIFSSTQLSPALQQWLDVILDYDFKIIHRDGILHVMPDQLSRMYSAIYSRMQYWGPQQLDDASFRSVIAGPSVDTIGDSLLPVMSIGSRSAHILAMPTSFIGEEEVKASSNTSTVTQSITSTVDEKEFKATSNIITADSNRVALLIELEKRGKIKPDSEQECHSLIRDAHAFGHFGRSAVFQRLWNKGFWWPNIRRHIEEALSNCDACIRYVVTKSGFHPLSYITADGPWHHIQIDTSIHLPLSRDGHVAMLAIIDVFTGFVVLRALRDHTAETVSRKLWKLFCLLGLPKIIQSDNGPEFANDVIRTLVKITGMDHRLISPYNPRADGKVERVIGSTMSIIKKLLHGAEENWALFVPFAQLTFNDKVASLTGSTPFSLMFGRPLNELKDYSSTTPKIIPLNDWKTHQEKIVSLIFPAVSTKIRGVKDKMMIAFNAHRRQLLPTSIPSGASVMLVDPVRQNKFEPKYIGPYSVVRRAQNGAYVLRDATGDILDRHVPADQLKVISRSPKVNDDVYVVRKILNHRGEAGCYEYLVDWKGYSEKTWEPEAHMLDHDVVKVYWDSLATVRNV